MKLLLLKRAAQKIPLLNNKRRPDRVTPHFRANRARVARTCD
jgi:hypothetical protein